MLELTKEAKEDLTAILEQAESLPKYIRVIVEKKYKNVLKEYKKQGYDVSEFEEMFKLRYMERSDK